MQEDVQRLSSVSWVHVAEQGYIRDDVRNFSPATKHDSLTQVRGHVAGHAYDREEVQNFSPATKHDSLTQVRLHVAGQAPSTLTT